MKIEDLQNAPGETWTPGTLTDSSKHSHTCFSACGAQECMVVVFIFKRENERGFFFLSLVKHATSIHAKNKWKAELNRSTCLGAELGEGLMPNTKVSIFPSPAQRQIYGSSV